MRIVGRDTEWARPSTVLEDHSAEQTHGFTLARAAADRSPALAVLPGKGDVVFGMLVLADRRPTGPAIR